MPMNRREMSLGKLPIDPEESSLPVFPVDRWRVVDDILVKSYSFRLPEQRRAFVTALMIYEDGVQHHADIRLSEDAVSISVTTKDLNKVTEVDKEYAAYCDILYKDIACRRPTS